ncbi:hypothetical protein BO83DRAFT_382208 [Aspergillus eucalypticola CBS 122712]|uniref:A-kinase anchor protein 7-like phosphoesterase domain-containing protein n=1 Tax=Aspergillus eucalypticola (strain CBS 122712 / IBT 29274) TaxID=1448314 RepID=A0A317URP9_ASPEC|nr:uncharacterized protein BO83DRAFT_382208 [Aspergillus eucalypticola CBS 122712]PWY63916.1 hypothetical protein BO83DRAFT_382208 [Aspergillus eucalypticola CBS 122712]
MSNPRPHPNQRKEKRPPLTHFLCLPLINATSLPQLESSLATFKASVPTFQPQHQHEHGHQHHQHAPQPQPLIPPSAHRPVGTLHLTLGVMSLPTPDRLSQAIRFLHSLDLEAMLRETQSSSPQTLPSEPTAPVSPFLISLESLHAIPRAKAATVLHAAPVDPTNRLYPFCVRLRDRFLEEGFLVGDKPAEKPAEVAVDVGGGEEQQQGQVDLAAGESAEMVPASVGSKPKVRPLLLHATIVNTIYAKGKGGGHGGRGGGRGGDGRGDKRKRQYTFDAREILARYRDYTPPGESVESTGTVTAPSMEVIENEGSGSGSGSEGESSLPKGKGTPFVWARDFPIESVCICEMGAKKLVPDLNGKDEGMNARLGEKYRVVAEKSLLFGS